MTFSFTTALGITTFSLWKNSFNCYRTTNCLSKRPNVPLEPVKWNNWETLWVKFGVKVDPKKIQAMQEWLRPMTLKCLRGFLGLTGYCRNFLHHYEKISNPLTNLLKKNSFHWTPSAEKDFTYLK
jgi:hypothetical protein